MGLVHHPSDWPQGGGEMGGRIRGFDWASTPLGPMESWPASLRTVVALMLATPQPAFVGWGRDAVSLYNDGYVPILGSKHPKALGTAFREVWSDVWDDVRPMLDATYEGRAQFFQDRPVPLQGRPDRPMSWFTFSSTPLSDENGAVAGFYCVATETTDKILAERMRRDSEDRFRTLAGLVPALLWQTDASGREITVNPRWCDYTGQTPEEAQGWGWLDTIHPEDRPTTEKLAQDGHELQRPIHQEHRIRDREGRYRWFQVRQDPVLDPDGRVTGWFGAAIDIHESRTAREARFRVGEERFRAIVETARDYAIFTTDSEGRIETWPPGAQEVFGWTAEEAVGESMDITFTPEDRARGAPEDERRIARETGQAPNVRWHLRKDGGQVFIEGVMRPLTGPHGRLTGYVKVGQDVTERRATEAALRESEARYRTLFEAIEAGFCVVEVDLDGPGGRVDYRVVEANSAFFEQTGFPSAILGHWLRAAAPALEEHWYEFYGRVARTGEPARFEQGSGHLGRWFDVSAFRVEAEPNRVAILFNDISARRRAELALHDLNATLEARVAEALAERKLLADVFEGTDAMISVAGPDLRLLAFNRPYAREVERLGGRRPQVGDSILDLYAGHPQLAAPVEANWRRAVAGEVFTVTEQHGDPGRYRRTYERRFEPVHDREGRLVGAYQYATDVTERLRDQRRAEEAEAARKTADALYRAYFLNSGEALFVVGVLPDGGFTFEEVNPTHRAALGFDIAAEPGRRIEEVLPPDVAAGVAANYRRVLETGEPQRYRETAELNGRIMHAETVLVPVRDETGRITRIVGSGRDMTSQVQAEEALRQSQKMEAMGQLTGGVAHDFNNLLTPILGALDRLQQRGLGTERDQRLVEGGLQSAERARTLVQRLLAFARRQPLQPRPIDLGDLVRGMADLVASTTGPQIKVAVEVEPDLPPALADANQLEMAVLNLAVNARDAMPDGGTLRITARDETVGPRHPSGAAPGRYVRLSVADTGTGMDEDTLARSVEPFYSTKGLGRGTGLGLSMVHGLAAQLGGALSIRSKPGLGTNVELWLPTAEDGQVAEAGPGDAPGDAASPASGTVLLVDDEELVRATAADMLADLGYAVIEASSAEEALRHLDAGVAPDLLLTDHLMPGLNGTELARIARARQPGLPVLVMSGYADAEGIDPDLPRLAKPYRRSDLAASLSGLARAAAPLD